MARRHVASKGTSGWQELTLMMVWHNLRLPFQIIMQKFQGVADLLDVTPWLWPMYETARVASTDSWGADVLRNGWLVRNHLKKKRRWFTPLHTTIPVSSATLTNHRATIRYFDDGNKMITTDD